MCKMKMCEVHASKCDDTRVGNLAILLQLVWNVVVQIHTTGNGDPVEETHLYNIVQTQHEHVGGHEYNLHPDITEGERWETCAMGDGRWETCAMGDGRRTPWEMGDGRRAPWETGDVVYGRWEI
jgi:hypothetical protein